MSIQTTADGGKAVEKSEGLRRNLAEFFHKPERRTWWGPTAFGYGIIFLFFGLFGTWAATAPLASGVIAQGKLRMDSGRQAVQHLEGGLVKEILVKDGDRVKKGEVLIRMDSLRSDAEFSVMRAKYVSVKAEQVRRIAERDGIEKLVYSEQVRSLGNTPELRAILDSEVKLFESRQDMLARQTEIRGQQVEQMRTELQAMDERDQSLKEQQILIEEELAGVQKMYDLGYAQKPRLLSLKRVQSQLIGAQGEQAATRARIKQRIHEQQLQIEAIRQSIVNEAISRLNDLDNELSSLEERMAVVDDRKKRVDIRAPRSGRVVDLRVITDGAVIGPGTVLMEIVPEDDDLIVDAKVKSKDIDSVKVGATVKVRILSFNPRLTPPIDGYVVSVAADVSPDSRPGQDVFPVLIRLDPKSVEHSLNGQLMSSGMPASTIIAVGERTLLTYWMTPLISSFELALREP